MDRNSAIGVEIVDVQFRSWHSKTKSTAPQYGSIETLAKHTPHIKASHWKRVINEYLPEPIPDTEDIYIHDARGLILTDMFVFEFSDYPTPAVHWLSTVLYSYLFSAASYKLQRTTQFRATKCEMYLMNLAPFALHALYAQTYASTDEVDVAQHIFTQFRIANPRLFGWMDFVAERNAHQRFRNIRMVLGVPRDLYSPLILDKRYSYLPKFTEPFVESLLEAFEAKMKYDIVSYHMSISKSNVSHGRWRLLHLREEATTDPSFLAGDPYFAPYSSVAFVPAMMLAAPFVDLQDSIASWGGIGRVMAHQMTRAFDRWVQTRLPARLEHAHGL